MESNKAVDGGGTRYNAGKTTYDMLPLSLMLAWTQDGPADHPATAVMAAMGRWQAGDEAALDDALAVTVASAGGAGLESLARAAEVFQYVTTRPVKPYPKWNWMRGMPWSIPLGCILRHALAWRAGQDNDPETGLPHIGHIQCNLVMLKFYAGNYKQGDDRPEALKPLSP